MITKFINTYSRLKHTYNKPQTIKEKKEYKRNKHQKNR
jgi:hypothetical protein